MKRTLAFTIACIALGTTQLSHVARAEEKKATEDARPRNPLAGQPAVRHRVVLRNKRFEISPAFEATVNADYKHTFAGGLKAEFSFTDMWSVGALGFFGASVNTGLTGRILNSLPETADDGDPTPTQQEYREHLNEMPLHGAVYVTLTPWYGKLAAFGKAFVNFDFYFSAGLAFAKLRNSCGPDVCNDPAPGINDPENGITPDNDPNNDPPLNDGSRLGVYLGGGIHVFMNQFIALDLSVRNYMFNDNPSGLDVFADRAVTDDDSKFMGHLFFGAGVSIFFPFSAKRTR